MTELDKIKFGEITKNKLNTKLSENLCGLTLAMTQHHLLFRLKKPSH